MQSPDDDVPDTVTISGREVSPLVAALIAQESDRLGILPGQVGDVVIPEPAPTHVMIADFNLSIATSAHIATMADAQGMHPKRLLEAIVTEHALGLERRARTRETRPSLAGSWDVGSDRSRGNRGDA